MNCSHRVHQIDSGQEELEMGSKGRKNVKKPKQEKGKKEEKK
jgi:hypothetical protein